MAYAELARDSLKAASMEHGLQTTAIYWESQLNSYRGVFGQATYGQKWTWKLVDDKIRSAWGLDAGDVAAFPYVSGSLNSPQQKYQCRVGHGYRSCFI